MTIDEIATTEAETIGNRIRERRQALQLTLKDIATVCLVSHVAVSKWERGHIKNVRGNNLIALAKKLEVSPQWILYGETRETRRAEATRLEDTILDTIITERFTAAELDDINRYLAMVIARRS